MVFINFTLYPPRGDFFKNGRPFIIKPMFSRRLFIQARAHTTKMALAVAFGWLGGVATILQAWFIARTINDVFLLGISLALVTPLLWALGAIMVTKALLAFLAENTANQLSTGIRAGLRRELIAKITRLGPAYTFGERTGELSLTLLDGVESLDAYFSQYLPQLALSASLPLTILFLVFPIDLLTGVVFLLTAPLIPFFMMMIGRYGEQLTHKQYASLSILSAHFFDVMQGITTLKVFGRSKYQTGVIRSISDQYREITMRVLQVTFLSSLALELLATLSTAIVAVEIGFRLLWGRLDFLPAFFILIIAPEFYFPLRQLGLKFHAGMTGVSAALRIFEVLDQPEPEPSNTQASSLTHLPSKKVQSLELRDVVFEYPSRDAFRLNGITMSFKRGQMTALVGKTGAGKSSIINLILRFILPTHGVLLADGIDIATLPLAEWRSLVGYVPQTPTLFFQTIRENLLFAKPDASDEQITQACQQSGILNFIRSLPDGFDTLVGERGSRLSGGQAQRLALARAFLKDAPIILLDEPTANLDPELEADMLASLKAIAPNKIVIVIAHRPSTALAADNVFLLQEGQVAESGEIAKLANSNGPFNKFITGAEAEL